MPVRNVNSGTPLSGVTTAPLWTDYCGTQSPSPVPTSYPDTEIRIIPGQIGSGVTPIDVALTNPYAINSIQVDFKMTGKLNDSVGIKLKHDALGEIDLTQAHLLQGALVVPNPNQPQTVTLSGLAEPPPGGRYIGDFGVATTKDVTIYEGDTIPLNSSLKGFAAATPGYPQTKNINAGFPPYGLLSENQFVNNGYYGLYTPAGSNLIVHGFKYTKLSNDSIPIKATVPQIHLVQNPFDNLGSYNAFIAEFSNLFGLNTYGLTLYESYGAHFFITSSVVYTLVEGPVGSGVKIDYTLNFYKYPDISWLIEELPKLIYEIRIPAQRIYEIPTDQGQEYALYSARADTLSFPSSAWRNKPAEGFMVLEVTATPANPGGVPTSPLVTPEPLRITDLKVTINYLPNSQYVSTGLSSTTPRAGVIRCEASGFLRPPNPVIPEDRALFAIFCQISGQTGIMCGISLLRKDRSKLLFDYNYFITTTCELDNFFQGQERSAIKFKAQDWGDPSFSARGNEGVPSRLDAQSYRRYPVTGPVGARVEIQGSRLTFCLLGGYPVLTFDDPTVRNIIAFSRYSLNVGS